MNGSSALRRTTVRIRALQKTAPVGSLQKPPLAFFLKD
jgi:hypothetical protein